MDFNTRKQELINQVNLVKAQLTDAQNQVASWKAKCKEAETQIASTLGAIALCEEAISEEKAKQEKSPIPEGANEGDETERFRV